MENVITKSCKQFGTVRQIKGTPNLWCGADVAKALGYKNSRKALVDHCKGVTKRDAPTNSGIQKMSFIPESDVYRLICHSKLPKAQEFEQWVFEDVIPEAVNNPYEQLIFDSYEYFDKTYNGQPVLSILDISKMTGIKRATLDWKLREKSIFRKGFDFYKLEAETLNDFKLENPKVPRMVAHMNVVTRMGFSKLMKICGIQIESPKCFTVNKSETEKPKTEYAVVLGNSYIQSIISRIKKQMVAVDVLIDKLNRYNIEINDMNSLRKTLGNLGMELGCEISGLARERISTTTEYKR